MWKAKGRKSWQRDSAGSVGEPLTDCAQEWAVQKQWWWHEFQRDGITICTTFTPFKPENTRLLARKNDIIIDIRVMYDHSKGKTLILSKNISLLVTINGV